jgi:hypothetical protein
MLFGVYSLLMLRIGDLLDDLFRARLLYLYVFIYLNVKIRRLMLHSF